MTGSVICSNDSERLCDRVGELTAGESFGLVVLDDDELHDVGVANQADGLAYFCVDGVGVPAGWTPGEAELMPHQLHHVLSMQFPVHDDDTEEWLDVTGRIRMDPRALKGQRS